MFPKIYSIIFILVFTIAAVFGYIDPVPESSGKYNFRNFEKILKNYRQFLELQEKSKYVHKNENLQKKYIKSLQKKFWISRKKIPAKKSLKIQKSSRIFF